MSDKNEYLAGIACRNPMNFTPKSHLDEIDRSARADRRWRLRFRILEFLAFFGAWMAFLWIMKR